MKQEGFRQGYAYNLVTGVPRKAANHTRKNFGEARKRVWKRTLT
jgi:hypothetical protein